MAQEFESFDQSTLSVSTESVDQLKKNSNLNFSLLKYMDLDRLFIPYNNRGGFLARQGYTYISALGQGAHAIVGLYQKNGKTHAIRIIDISKHAEQATYDNIMKGLNKELQIYDAARQRGPRICENDTYDFILHYEILKDSYDDNVIYFVSEPMQEDLAKWIKTIKQLSFEERLRYIDAVVCQIVYGLSCLHEIGIIHGDLKASNILIDINGAVKLADFGGGALTDGSESYMTEITTKTPIYMPPEVTNILNNDVQGRTGRQYLDALKSPKYDSWSLGVMILKMLNDKFTGKVPAAVDIEFPVLGSLNQVAIDSLIAQTLALFPTSAKTHADYYHMLLTILLQVNPVQRAEISDIVHSNWFSKGCKLMK